MTRVDPVTGLVERPAPRPYPFGPPTIAALLDEPVTIAPDRLALVDGERTWTYRELDDVVERTAAALLAVGAGPGSRVAWTLPNCAELPIGLLATQRIGAIWLGINGALAAPEKQFILDDAEVTHYVATSEVLAATNGPATRIERAEWHQRVREAGVGRPEVGIDPHSPAAMAYTSGTTGRPKGAVHSQHNLVWPGLVSLLTDARTDDERQGTPLAHTILNMLVLGPISALARRSTGVVLHSTRAEEFAAAVAAHRVTRTTIVPTMAHDLVAREIDPALLATLDSVIVGGAACPADIRRRFHARFGVRAIAGYGLSEAPTGVVRESPDEPISDSAAGCPMEPFAVTARDDAGAVLPPGEEGEICIGATADGDWAGCWTPMLGYWRRPDATAAALADGVLHTDDIGSVDADGRVTITGRRSDLILRGGANVSPVEVEHVLLAHPGVAEAAVFGVADERLGERVAAVVVPAGDAPLDVDELRAHCGQRLAAYKIPERIDVVASLPRNAMGKVVKTDLAERRP